MKTKIPYDHAYATLIGIAVYNFSYFEWRIIFIIDALERGFLDEYSRGSRPMPSGTVRERFQKAIISTPSQFDSVSQDQLQECHDRFYALIPKRNALIHGHPATDKDGSQVLIFQDNVRKAIPDMTWRNSDIEGFIKKTDEASTVAGHVFQSLSPKI